MRDSDYYPAGAANDRNAPWNEVVVPEKDFDVCVKTTLTRGFTITTNDYNPCCDECESWNDTSDTDWAKAYVGSCYTIPQMLKELEKFLEKALEDKDLDRVSRNKYTKMLDDCKDWDEEELEVWEE